MGKLTVDFIGLCVHLPYGILNGIPHRVVIINASRDETIHGKSIKGHHARLEIGVLGAPALDGVLLTIPNAIPPPVPYADTFESCIPHLSNYTENLPALSQDVVRKESPSLAAAYFDAVGHMWAGVTHSGASVAVLDVETDGPPVLRMTSFQTKTVKDLPLPDGAVIQIVNTGTAEGDDHDYDFLLNFKIMDQIPDDATWPTEPMTCPTNPHLPITTIGPGCSNSNYP